MVIVQLSRSRRLAIGLPTMLERPTTSAFSPANEFSRSLSSMRQPSGVQGTTPSAPLTSRPTFMGWKPSTSLAGSSAPSTAASSI